MWSHDDGTTKPPYEKSLTNSCNKSWVERIICIPQQNASFSNTAVSNHKYLKFMLVHHRYLLIVAIYLIKQTNNILIKYVQTVTYTSS